MSFKAVNWSPNELLGERKTDQMGQNAEWLYNNTPRAIYTTGNAGSGLRRTQGIKIAAGRVVIGKRTKSDSATAAVRFGNYFSPNCEPLITTGVVAEHQSRIFCTINGLGKLLPDARGFNVEVNVAAEKAKHDKIARSFFVAWQAMGY